MLLIYLFVKSACHVCSLAKIVGPIKKQISYLLLAFIVFQYFEKGYNILTRQMDSRIEKMICKEYDRQYSFIYIRQLVGLVLRA